MHQAEEVGPKSIQALVVHLVRPRFIAPSSHQQSYYKEPMNLPYEKRASILLRILKERHNKKIELQLLGIINHYLNFTVNQVVLFRNGATKFYQGIEYSQKFRLNY